MFKKVSTALMAFTLVFEAFGSVTAPAAGGKLVIGYDATSVIESSGQVTQWIDQVGESDAYADLVAQRPVRIAINTGAGENQVLQFSGINRLKTDPFASSITQPTAIFIVANFDTIGTYYLFDGIDGSNRNALYTRTDFTFGMFGGSQIINTNIPATAGTFKVYSAVFNGASSLMRIDGTGVLSGNVGAQSLLGLSIGTDRNGNQTFQGKIAEVLVYDGGLNTEQIVAIEEYLKYKYIVAKDPHLASNESPINSTSGLEYNNVVLNWTAGVSAQAANGHGVYFGTDKTSVTNATESNPLGVFKGRQTATTCNPGELQLGKTYYWRVDEYNDSDPGSPWQGDVWSFTISEFTAIEDFDAYTSDSELTTLWNPAGNAWVSLLPDPIPMTTGIHSMRLSYSNDSSPYYSAAVRNYSTNQVWTLAEVEALYVRVLGAADNIAAPVYVEVWDGTNTARQYLPVNTYTDSNADTAVVTNTAWTLKGLPISGFIGVDFSKIRQLIVGVGDGSLSTATGTIYIDDIRLYPARCLLTKPTFDVNGDCVVDFKDFAIFMNQWLDSGYWPQ